MTIALALASWFMLQGAAVDSRLLRVGETLEGELVDSDQRVHTQALDKSFTDAPVLAQRFAVEAATPGLHSIELRSYFFDAYLVLRDEQGNPLGEDDDGLLGTHARITADLDPAKHYVIEACALHGGRGLFELRLFEGSPPPKSARERRMADLDEARRAVEVCERVRGPEHLETARALNELALQLRVDGDFDAAVPLFERALAIYEKTRGSDHPDTAAVLSGLGLVLKDQGKFARARVLYERALAIREQALGPDHADTAQSLDHLGTLLGTQGDFATALALTERALAIRERILGPEHPATAKTVNNLAALYWSQGELAAARPLFERALAINEKALGADDPSTAQSRNNLAVLLEWQGDFAAARPLHEQALAIRERTLGPEHPDTAASLNNLALLCKEQGDDAVARALFERAIPILEKTLGRDHLLTGKGLGNLAWLLQAQGDFAAARPLSERALAISERALGPDHPDTARMLNNHGLLLQAQGDLAAAQLRFERALAIWEKSLGPNAPEAAIALHNLASLDWKQGDLASARPLCERALAIRERVLGPDHPDTASSLYMLAVLRKDAGDFVAARSLFERATAILQTLLGPDHPDTAACVGALALLALDQGDHGQAAELALRSWRSSRAGRSALVATLSERESAAYLAKVRTQLEVLLSSDAGSASTAAGAVLDWKGQAGRVLFASRSQLLGRLDESRAVELDALRSVQSRLSKLAFAHTIESSAAHVREFTELCTERERLERGVRGSLDAVLPNAPTISELRRNMAEGAAFLDVFVHHVYEPALGTGATYSPGRWGERRVSAWITRPDRDESVHVDLGAAAELDAAVTAFLRDLVASRGMRASDAERPENLGRDLRRRLWEPLAAHLEGVTRVFVSPDGALCTLPFETLTQADGSFLVEHMAFIYEQTPEVLTLPMSPGGQRGSLLAVGGVDYARCASPTKDPIVATDAAASLALAGGTRAQAPGSTDERGGFQSFWAPLGHTSYESDVVSALHESAFPDDTRLVLRGDIASEEALKRELPQHRVVHIATHGFFNPEGVPSLWKAALAEAEKGRSSTGGENLELAGKAPGLLSGLVCAGANAEPEAGRDDGYLTAEEVGWLDLSKVELVVLSACETALGKAESGEGLLGLRRAFELAGAKTVVSSLWSVKDESTAKLMQSFYENLWRRHMGRSDALRAAQLEMLARNRAQYRDPLPSTWGGFVLSGEWR